AYDTEKAVAIAAVARACQLTHRVFHQLVADQVITKDDQSPVTVADYGAQAVVLHALAAAFPADPVVAEEAIEEGSASAAQLEAVRALVNGVLPTPLALADIKAAINRGAHDPSVDPQGRFWTLDPIDGTKGFLRGDQYAVCLCLIDRGVPQVAVMGGPNLPLSLASTAEAPIHQQAAAPRGALLIAVRGEGVEQRWLDVATGTVREGGVPVQMRATTAPSDAAFVEGVEHGHSDQATQNMVATRLGIRGHVQMDSQCKYAVLARGDADVYLRLPVKPGYREKIWDHAPGVLLVQEAGGIVTDMHGAPLDFTRGRTLVDQQGVIAASAHFHPLVMEVLRDAK
ncbi:hypothetical protein CXG81DRAFT_502, partial [Caulochytrium protostelioides]